MTRKEIEDRRAWWQAKLDDGLVHPRESLEFWNSEVAICDMALASLDHEDAVVLLWAWVAGCGDEHFSTKEQCRNLLQKSADYLSRIATVNTPRVSEQSEAEVTKDGKYILETGKVYSINGLQLLLSRP